jgi:hypothetical protein
VKFPSRNTRFTRYLSNQSSPMLRALPQVIREFEKTGMKIDRVVRGETSRPV